MAMHPVRTDMRSRFGEHVFQALLKAAEAVEKEHLEMLREQEQVLLQRQPSNATSPKILQSRYGTHSDMLAISFGTQSQPSEPPQQDLDVLLVEEESRAESSTQQVSPALSGLRLSPTDTEANEPAVDAHLYKLLDDWDQPRDDDRPDADTAMLARLQYLESLQSMLGRNESLRGNFSSSGKHASSVAISPKSFGRMMWDMLASVVLLYEAFYTPMT
eukprot:6487019-Amphidinium_carterae.1